MVGIIVITIVNVIASLSFLLGGQCMKDAGDSPGDHSIGYRSKRSCSNDEAWKFANSKCGEHWIRIGTAALILTISGIAVCLINSSAAGYVQWAVMIGLTAAIIASAVIIEKQLKERFSDSK